ncbi:MAG TPA: O-antigen ligase family protein [Chloroflexota bacterium]|nr:O-antigen ligase family protein [Chloroflexota bacterium]
MAGAGVAAAAGAGWLVAARSPLVAGGAVAGAGATLWAMRRPLVALLALIAVIAILPFGVVPLRLGLAPTFLDVLTLAVFLLWLALAAARRCATRLTPAGVALVALAVSLWGAAVLSQDTLRLDEAGRTFLKLLAAHLLFIPVLNLVGDPADRRRLVGSLLLLAALEGAIGLVLYAVPRDLALRALVALGPLGYPTSGEVLRYRPDTDILRATGTSVDPNMLGAMLMVAAALAVPLLLARRPALPKPLVALSLLAIVPCLLLTESRGSWLGLAAGVGLVAALRHRRLLLVLVLATPLVLTLPQAGRFTSHLLSGLRAGDRASAMRLGELQNAATIIAEHPWFGVGWGDGAQSIELTHTLGVSNIYLTVAERSGLPALAVYAGTLLCLARVLWPAWRRRWRSPDEDGLFLGLIAALVATQVAGMLDHHFVRFPHLVSLLWLVAALAVAEATDA